jgi:hypothetical protein
MGSGSPIVDVGTADLLLLSPPTIKSVPVAADTGGAETRREVKKSIGPPK